LFESTISQMKCLSIQTLASRILAVALCECLPGFRLLSLEEACGGFFCEFIFFQSFSSEILVQLEERIRQIIREQRPVQIMEMVPCCAANFLRQADQTDRASQVEMMDGFVQVMQIGSFADYCKSYCGRHTGEAGVIRLLENIKIGKGRYRIFGVAAVSKKELQDYIRRWKQFGCSDHERKGLEWGWWDWVEGERIWLAAGLAMRRRFYDFWLKRCSAIAVEVEGPKELLRKISQKNRCVPVMQIGVTEEVMPNFRGLLDQKKSLTLQADFFDAKLEQSISFLQIVVDSLTILGFTTRAYLTGSSDMMRRWSKAIHLLNLRVDEWRISDQPTFALQVLDSLRCAWTVVSVEERRRSLCVSVMIRLERNFALLIEKCKNPRCFEHCLQESERGANKATIGQVVAGEIFENQ
jgi:hypothetical protein